MTENEKAPEGRGSANNILNNSIVTHSADFAFVYADWEKSGISKDIIKEYIQKQYITVDKYGYSMHYPDLYSNFKTNYYNKRLQHPTKSKYIKPKDLDSRLFRPLHLRPECLSNPQEYIIITEGEKKAIKAVQEGFNCVALSGVWAWKKDPEKEASNEGGIIFYTDDDYLAADIIPDIANANFKGKEIYLCYDNDMWQKEQVKNALYQLSAYLISEKKAIVKIIDLPKMEDK